MTFELTSTDRVIKVFNYNPVNNEYIGQSDAWVPAHLGLPAYCTQQKPPVKKKGQAIVFIDGAWQVVEDNRGVTVYDVASLGASSFDKLGPIPEGKTLMAPASEFDKWNGKKWMKDAAAEKTALISQAQQDKKQRMTLAGENISILSYAKESGQATAEEIALLNAWQDHRLQLSRVDVNAAQAITWPGKPDDVA